MRWFSLKIKTNHLKPPFSLLYTCILFCFSIDTVDKSLKKTDFSGTGGFLLDNLNAANLMTSSITSCGNQMADVNDRTILPHQRSRPPPMSPAPPPPSHLPTSSFKYLTRNENFELKSLMLDSDSSYNPRQCMDMSKSVFVTSSNFYPNNLPSAVTSLSSSPVFHTMMNCKGHNVVVNNSFPKSHLLLTTSSSTRTSVTVGVSSNKSIGTVNRIDNLTNHEMSNYLLQSAILNGLKREPPSGGSVHDGTDGKNDCLLLFFPSFNYSLFIYLFAHLFLNKISLEYFCFLKSYCFCSTENSM